MARRSHVSGYDPGVSTLGPEAEILHEIDAEGRDAGVELEQLFEDTEIKEPFDPRQIDVTTESRSLDVLLKRLANHQIDLDPDFQRSRGIWNDAKKSLLIESLLLRIPLPTFYVAEVQNDDEDLGDDRWAVVDGIQRLSTVAQFVQPKVLGLPPLRLTGLEYLKSETNKTFAELSTSLQLRVLESQFTIQVIRRSTPEAVKLNIFARINTGGVPLSAQELRHALIPGQARSILRAMADSKEFQAAVAGSISSTRMVDREMALRFTAFRLVDPAKYRDSDFDRFLRDIMRSMNSWSSSTQQKYLDDFRVAMGASSAIFGRDAFRKRYHEQDPRRPVSKALFEAVSVGLASIRDEFGDDSLAVLAMESSAVRGAFVDLMNDRSFDRAVSQGTGDPVRVRLRFQMILALLRRFVSEND